MSDSPRVRLHKSLPFSTMYHAPGSHNSYYHEGLPNQKGNRYYQDEQARRWRLLHERPVKYLRAYGTRTEVGSDVQSKKEESFEDDFQRQILANHRRQHEIQLQRKRQLNQRRRLALQKDLEQAKNSLRMQENFAIDLQQQAGDALLNNHPNAVNLTQLSAKANEICKSLLGRVHHLENALWGFQNEG